MTWEQLDKMRSCETRPNIDAKPVKLTCVNGDVWEGFVEFVDDEHSQEIENQRLIRNIHHYVKFAPIGDSWSFGSTCWVANSICSDP
jgi:hypothetical protein